MEQLSISVEIRQEKGKGPSRRVRKAGRLPGVLYGMGTHATITVEPRLIHKLLVEEGGRNKVLNLEGTGLGGKHAIVKDFQVDPVSRQLIHVDLLEIDVSKKIEVTVPLNYIGKSIGVAEGGVLNIIGREVAIRCLPTQIPKHLDIDVTALAIGHSLHLDDIKLPEGMERGVVQNLTLCTVVPPTKEEEATPSLAPSAEPEVITEKKEAAAADGAAPAEGKKEEKKK